MFAVLPGGQSHTGYATHWQPAPVKQRRGVGPEGGQQQQQQAQEQRRRDDRTASRTREWRVVRIAVVFSPIVRAVEAEQVGRDGRHQVAHQDALLDALGVDVQDRDLAHDREAGVERRHRLVDVLQHLAVREHFERREGRRALVGPLDDLHASVPDVGVEEWRVLGHLALELTGEVARYAPQGDRSGVRLGTLEEAEMKG
uniref:Uncharacterized protein n=1 Tax=Anopheles atroparvus TaxID=41427 RepID=A0A182IUA8_ANOAO